MSSTDDGAGGEYDHCCKVGRVADDHSLSPGVGGGVNEYLAARWRGDDDYPETSLAELVEWFDRRVMGTVYRANDRLATDSRLAAEYDTLRSDDEVDRSLLVDDLAEDGIDGDALRGDFVSVATMYRHLTDCLGVSKPDADGRSDSDWEADKIAYAVETARENIADALQSWENKGTVPFATDASIGVRVTLECPVCHRQVSVERARERGHVCETHMTEGAGPPDRY
ncbi:hypothetical protein BRD19_01595 [Halobacteriales archaeon SW_7_65_23]|nr:MAG: hypothetical protein BRD19_01595 [Halobacteriales archaeon SW_7_65_23]